MPMQPPLPSKIPILLLLILLLLQLQLITATKPKNSLYSALNIPPTASTSDIKKAYRKAALQYHPDKVPPSQRSQAEHKFKEINKAYEWLSDEKKRKLYDAYGEKSLEPNFSPLFAHEGDGGGGGMSGSGGRYHPGGGTQTFHFGNGGFHPGGGSGFGGGMFGGPGMGGVGGFGGGGADFAHVDLNELLRQMMGGGVPMHHPTTGGGGSAFGMDREWHQQQQPQQSHHHQQSHQQQPPRRKQHKEYIKPVYCSLEDLCQGCTKKLKVSYPPPLGDKIYHVQIQPGWKEGTKIKFPSSRSSSSSTSPSMDEVEYPPITFVVREKKHAYLQRHNTKNGDLLWKCKLTPRQAERGAKLKLPLPDGSVLEMESKKGIQSGEQIRVSGRGMLCKAAAGGEQMKKGDVVIEFVVE